MAVAKQGNVKKYYSYKLAWERIDAALEQGFPLEAIAIEESIISDRLRAYMEYIGRGLSNKSLDFRLKAFQKELEKRGLFVGEYEELHTKINAWREGRNQALHRIVYTNRATESVDADEFLKKATKTAKSGKTLTRKLCSLIKRKEVGKKVED